MAPAAHQLTELRDLLSSVAVPPEVTTHIETLISACVCSADSYGGSVGLESKDVFVIELKVSFVLLSLGVVAALLLLRYMPQARLIEAFADWYIDLAG